MSNQEIARLLKNVAAAYTIKDEKKFRFQILAYQKAADTIEHLNTEIIEFYKNNSLDTIPGVGASIKSHIEELMEKGNVSRFEWVLKDIPEAVFPLLDVPSFGPKKAYALVKHFNLKSKATVLDDLEKLAEEEKIANLAGFGEKSQADVIRAIQEFRKGKGKTTRMALPYAQEVADKLVEYLKKSKDVERVEPLGSLRRKVYGSGYNWVDLEKANKLENPGVLFVGTKLTIPEVQKITVQNNPEQVSNSGPSISGDSYKIVEGDHLWGIALRKYGDGYKWPEIARVNNLENPDLILSGNTVKLPR